MSRTLPLLVRSSLRYLTRHPWQTGLSVLGVALGVAVMVGVDVANESAQRAFGLSTEAVTGRTTHQILGGPSGLEETLFAEVVKSVDVPAAPVVEGWVTIPRAQRTLRVLGVDPFSERPFRPYLAGLSAFGSRREGSAVDLGAFLTEPRAFLLSAETAQDLGLEPGGTLPVRVDETEEPTELELLGTLQPADRVSREALSNLMILDLAAAQELLGSLGRLDRIDLIVPEGPAGEAVLERVREVLPPGARVVASEARSAAIREMTAAFRLNLTALSLLALLCGMFLIYNTMTFSVVQRRTGIGTLRALGTTRRQILTLILGEATLVGLVGTALGLASGVALGRGLVRLTTRTINDLYFALEVQSLAVPPAVLVQGAVLGLAATLAAAAAPAWEATTAPPRSALLRSELEARARRALPRTTAGGLALLILGGVLLLPESLVTSFAGLFGVLVGCALLVPLATVGLMRVLSAPAGAAFGILGRMAARGVTASLSRTAVAIAALVVAVSVTVGVGIMIDSFRGTVERWLESTLQADLYVSPIEERRIFDEATFGPEVPRRFRQVEGVDTVSTVRRVTLETMEDGEASRMFLLAFDIDEKSFGGFDLKRGDPDDVWPRFQTGDAVIVSEPFAYRNDLEPGDPVTLPTDRGPRTLPVAAVYYDYASDQGVVLLARDAYDRWFDDRRVSGISVFLEDGASEDAVIGRLRQAAGPAAARLTIQSNRELKRASLQIFDRTFRVTAVLRLLAGLVAFIGVLSALMALELERARELGVLRANGMTPRQVWKLVTSQTGLMGFAAGVLSVPVGWVMAWIMIYVINRRSFGWTLDMAVDPRVLAEALLLALTAAILAGLYPAYKMARTRPALALREE